MVLGSASAPHRWHFQLFGDARRPIPANLNKHIDYHSEKKEGWPFPVPQPRHFQFRYLRSNTLIRGTMHMQHATHAFKRAASVNSTNILLLQRIY